MAHINRSFAALRIFADDLLPDEVTNLLGHAPTSSYAKGDTQTSKTTGKVRVRKYGAWMIEADKAEPEDVNGQAMALLGKLTGDLAVWRDLKSRYEMDLFCGLFMDRSNEGGGLSATTLAALGERGIELALDIYAPSQEDVTGPDALPSGLSLQDQAENFYFLASGFCRWCEQGLNGHTPQALVSETSAQVAALYAAGLRLPSIDVLEAAAVEETEEAAEAPVTPERDADLVSKLKTIFARLPVTNYQMSFRPDRLDHQQPCIGNLQDDLLDIHNDIRKGLWLWQEFGGSLEARAIETLWEWRFSLDAHWGRHAASALYVLQGYKEDEE